MSNAGGVVMVAVESRERNPHFFWLSPLFAESGWYFKSPNRRTVGPFIDREDAEDAAKTLVMKYPGRKLQLD